MNKKSLVQEVSKLKSLLDVAAASATVSSSGNLKNGNNLNDEEEDDMDVSFIREEVATQKEIIIARDQVSTSQVFSPLIVVEFPDTYYITHITYNLL